MTNKKREQSTAARREEQTSRRSEGGSRGGRHDRIPALAALVAVGVFLFLYRRTLLDPYWIPVHDTLTQFTEFLYAYAAFQHGELPLWNSYLYGGQPFYLLLNHGLLLNPLAWLWFAVGALTHLLPKQIFVACHLTEVVFFASGGFLLVRQLTRRSFAGWTAFLILLFCGESLYWTTQVYSLSIVEYVPWVFFLFLRYLQQQTVGRAVLFALFLAVCMNVYYPAYLAAFVVTIILLLALLYPHLYRGAQYRRFALHALLVVPLIGLLLLPTFLIYREITQEYYQIARYPGPDQDVSTQPAVPSSMTHVAELGKEMFVDMFVTPPTDYADAAPLVGILALSFALYELLSLSRRGVFWSLVAVCMALNTLGRVTPFYELMRHLSPFYAIIGATVFFGSFLTLTLTILAAMGAQRFSVRVRRRPSIGSPLRWRHHPGTVVVVLLILVLTVPAGQRTLPLLAAVILAAMVYARWSRVREAARRTLIAQSALLVLFLVAGPAYLGRITGRAYYNWRSNMFSYSSAFGFSNERPLSYLRAQPLGPGLSGECCIDYYHLAERIDAPYSFDRWQSLHTQFVSKAYYRSAMTNGFGKLMQHKFYWFDRYSVKSNIEDYQALPERKELVLASEAPVRIRGLRSQAALAPPAQEGDAYRPDIVPVYKSANTLVVATQTDRPRFLLYTDNYHEGFIAKIDGQPAPVLKAMGVLKAVEIPEGRHVVEFIFQPVYRFVLIGYLLISVPAVLWVVGANISSTMRSRRPKDQNSSQ